MTSIVMHAGLPKTGTSAVQAWLAANTEQLASIGVDYPFHAVDDNQISAGNAGLLMSPDERGLFRPDPEQIEVTLEQFEQSGCDTLLVSSEAFLPELTGLVDAMPAQMRIVLYVRDPLEFLESDYNQRVKRIGHLQTFVPDPDAYGGWLGHEWLYRALNNEKVRSRVTLRPYHRDLFVGGDLLTDLLATAGIDATRLSGVGLSRVNSSYSLHALEIKRALNALPLGKALDERLDLRLQQCPLGPDRYSLIAPADHERLRQIADDELHAIALKYDIDTLEPMRTLLRDQPAKPYHPQRLSEAEVEAVADHLGRHAVRLIGRLATALRQHPEIELAYPTLRDAIFRAEALDDDPPPPPKRKWWQRAH